MKIAPLKMRFGFPQSPARTTPSTILVVILALFTSSLAYADESDAKRLLKGMSDYMGEQTAYSFDYDSILGIVTVDGQNLELASSGKVKLHRPNKIHATRSGGFVDTETFFDGKTMTLLGKSANLYAQIDVAGSVDDLIDVLQTKYSYPLPAGDLLLTNSYDRLMEGVVDSKDLGSGVINGVECDYLAFSTEEVDWQIWIAHGDKPYPCRFVITSKQIAGQPQYSVQLRNWETHKMLPELGFSFENSSKADKVDIQEMQDTSLPQHFEQAEAE